MTWRDGVHLTGTPIWCDARRRRDVCFVSSADRIGAAGHGQLIGTSTALALVAARGDGPLSAPLRRPFTLGTLRLELIPSGRTYGSAALHVDNGGRTVLYAGAVRTDAAAFGAPATGTGARGSGLEPAEVRSCDAAVVAAPFGEPHHRFAPRDVVAERVVAWVRARLATGTSPVLVVDTASDGLELAACLAREGLAVAGSRAVRDAALRLASASADLEVPTIRAPGREPGVVIRLESDRARRAPHAGASASPDATARSATALISGRALDPHPTWDAGFAWPFAAGREQLLAWIEQTRAKDVFVTGACAEAIVRAVGARARLLGPPRQMALFPREAVS